MRIGGEPRWIAADDAGLYRDALGAVPPGGLPEAFLTAVHDPLRRLVAAVRRDPRAVRRPRAAGPLRGRRHGGAARAAARGRAGAGRDPPRRDRDGALRPRGPASAAADVARRPAAGDRAGRRARTGAVRPDLAGDRPPPSGGGRPRPPARDPGAAAGPARCRSSCGRRTCCRGGSARTRRPGSTGCARPARSSGSGPDRRAGRGPDAVGWRCTSATTRRRSVRRWGGPRPDPPPGRSGAPPPTVQPTARAVPRTTRCDRRSPSGRCSSARSSRRCRSPRPSCATRSGT